MTTTNPITAHNAGWRTQFPLRGLRHRPGVAEVSRDVRRHRALMEIAGIVTAAFLLAGCATSRQSASLSPEQAAAQAARLANNKAAELYHCRPFQAGRPAQLVAGHWIWSEQRGFGHGDIVASVELAADGTPRNVEVKLLHSVPLLDSRGEKR